MRSPLRILVALSLLLLLITPPRPASTPPPLISRPVDLSASLQWGQALSRKLDERIMFDAAWWRWVEEQDAKKPTTTRRQSAPTELSGDRFDRLSACEAHNDPTATSPDGRYLGAFQFSRSSYAAATGGDTDPRDESYEQQKQTAMYWASITTPSTQWPLCWPRSG